MSRKGKNSAGQVDPVDTFPKDRFNYFVISTPVLKPIPHQNRCKLCSCTLLDYLQCKFFQSTHVTNNSSSLFKKSVLVKKIWMNQFSTDGQSLWSHFCTSNSLSDTYWKKIFIVCTCRFDLIALIECITWVEQVWISNKNISWVVFFHPLSLGRDKDT